MSSRGQTDVTTTVTSARKAEMTATTVEAITTATTVSRQSLETELTKIGVSVEPFRTLTVDQLSDLLFSLNKAANSGSNGTGQESREDRTKKKDLESIALSQIDKKILKALLEWKGNPSSITLSKELDIPLSTVQRRRKRLEEECVRESYSLRYEKFGKRNITFIISLGAGDKSIIANDILGLDKVRQVSRTFGDSADLKVEAVVETNKELMDTSEKIKALPGIQKISWFESLEILGKKKDIDISLLESV
jgi:DNA-binding Lrp family transcriptional regulator